LIPRGWRPYKEGGTLWALGHTRLKISPLAHQNLPGRTEREGITQERPLTGKGEGGDFVSGRDPQLRGRKRRKKERRANKNGRLSLNIGKGGPGSR